MANPKPNLKLQSALQNKNVKWILHNIYKYESGKINGKVNLGGHNQSSGDSTAFGAAQFIGSTRNKIKNKYNIDAWKNDRIEQELAVVALIDSNGDLDKILNGDFKPLKNNKYWEAFSNDKNFKKLSRNKPEGWEYELEKTQKNVVFEPVKSWNSLPEDVRNKKKYWFDKKYKGDFPHEIKTNEKGLIDDKSKIKKLDDASSYVAYSEFKKETNKEKEKLQKQGASYQKTYNDNITALTKKYQKKFGTENLTRGAQLVSEENEFVFKKNNKHYQKIKKLNSENEKLLRKKDSGVELSEKDNKKLESIQRQIKGSYANIRLDADSEKLKSLKTKMNNSEFGSKDYNQAKSEYDKVKTWNDKIKSGFQKESNHPVYKREQETINYYQKQYDNIEDKNSLHAKNKLAHLETLKRRSPKLNVNEYIGDEDLSNISDLYQTEVFEPTTINEDDSDNVINPDDTIDNNETTEVKDTNDYSFDTSDIDGTTSSMYQDDLDNQEKQSVKGFLKDNPMSVLSAALGIKGVVDSQTDLPDIDVKDQTALSNSFYEYLGNLEKISKQGFTPEEEAAHLKQINDGYMASVDLAVQASGGNRANVLAQSGQLNANKNKNLLAFASQDAQLQRQNLEKYGQALQYKEAFNERKDTRMQANEYNRQRSEFERASSKREGGAALAASSIQSLVNSVRDYKETGEGSALDRYMKYMEKKRENEGLKINPDTKKPFQNAEEEAAYNAKQKDLNFRIQNAGLDFSHKLKSASLTKVDKELIFKKANLLQGEDKFNFFKNYDLNKGKNGLDDYFNPEENMKKQADFSSLNTPLKSNLAEENIYKDFIS